MAFTSSKTSITAMVLPWATLEIMDSLQGTLEALTDPNETLEDPMDLKETLEDTQTTLEWTTRVLPDTFQ